MGKPDTCNVISGLPHLTVLGPVLFHLFINDLLSVINNPCKLFANEMVVYYITVKSKADVVTLQEDINRLADLETTLGMKFHPDK